MWSFRSSHFERESPALRVPVHQQIGNFAPNEAFAPGAAMPTTRAARTHAARSLTDLSIDVLATVLVELDPSHSKARCQLGWSLVKQEKEPLTIEAERLFRQVAALDPRQHPEGQHPEVASAKIGLQ